MRRSIGRSWRIPNDQYNALLNNTPFLLQSASPFCTSGGGRGRGRGGGFPTGPSKFGFTREDEPVREASEKAPVSLGHGRGRLSGQVPQTAFGSFVREPQIGSGRGRGASEPPQTGLGRGRGASEPPARDAQSKQPIFTPKKDGGDFGSARMDSQSRQPNFNPRRDGGGGDFRPPQMDTQSRQPNFNPRRDGGDFRPPQMDTQSRQSNFNSKNDGGDSGSPAMNTQSRQPIFIPKKDGGEIDSTTESMAKPNPNPTQWNGANLHSSVASGLSGAGRGKPMKQPDPASQVKEENRHIRVRDQSPARPKATADASPAQPKLSHDEAIKKAIGILSRGDDAGGRGGEGGRGRGRGMGRGRGRGRGGFAVNQSSDQQFDGEDPSEGAEEAEQKFLEMLGPDKADKFLEGFEEVCDKVVPSPMQEAYVNAYYTNLSIECEPEYLMGDLCSNPDVDDTPPISLRDALEKMKPFLMAYDGYQNQEEWEEAIKQTMEHHVPLWEEIIEQYCGPDRITAMKQQEELEKVAKTVPDSAPASVKHFTNRALLSIQNNPSWGFNKKYQFMDKLVREVSQ